MRSISQANRLFRIETPLGADKLIVRKLDGTEEMSGNFRFELILASEDWEIDFDQILGKTVTVSMKQSDDSSERYFHGYVKRFQHVHAPGRLANYYAEVVPWLWFLTLTADCRIFQNMSVPDIIEDTFQRFGFQDYELTVSEHDEWDYCVQYRETAFSFVNRLMEIEGIYYYWKFEEGKHTMVIIDDMGSHEDCPFESTFRFDRVTGSGYKHGPDTVYQWKPQKKVLSGKYSHKEYNYETPDDPMYADVNATDDANPNAKWEIYDYPGEFDVRGEAEEWVRWRIEEQERDADTSEGAGNCRSMIPGYKFDLTEHYRADQNRNYLIRSVTHHAEEGTLIGGSDAQEASYENSFTCLPSDTQYRHDRKTTKPSVKGSQTAFVVGPKGEEIYTDEKGRVKVKFHWDRTPGRDENSSCWIRVMQPWTGKHWGQIWIPRIGQEVIVDFLEGDPDRPIITGCVYNEDNQPPYTLPDNKTVSGVQTRSSKGGGDQNYNEVKLEDKIGEEMINIQAEKDMNTLVKHDQTLTVRHDKKSQIENDMTTEVDNDKKLVVKNNMSVEVQNDLTIVVDNDTQITINNDLKIGVKGNQHGTVSGNAAESVKGNRSAQVTGNDQVKVQGNVNVTALGNITLKSMGSITLQAMQGITFKGPSGFIDIGMAGITIEGDMVYVNCGGAAGEAEDAAPDDPATPQGFDDSTGMNDSAAASDANSSAGDPSSGEASPSMGSSPGDSSSGASSPFGGDSSGGGSSPGGDPAASGDGSGGAPGSVTSTAPDGSQVTLMSQTPQMDNTLSGSVSQDAAASGADSGGGFGGGSLGAGYPSFDSPGASGSGAGNPPASGSGNSAPSNGMDNAGPGTGAPIGGAPAGSSAPLVGNVTQTYSPGVQITGTPDFVAKVRTALDQLKATPTGANIMSNMAATGKTLTVSETTENNGHSTPADVNASQITGGAPGSGSNSTITWNPNFKPGGIPNTVVLGHEMIHSLHGATGTRAVGTTGGVRNEELQTTGLAPYSATGLTENQLRTDLGVPARTSY